ASSRRRNVLRSAAGPEALDAPGAAGLPESSELPEGLPMWSLGGMGAWDNVDCCVDQILHGWRRALARAGRP
ncbi:hypothetical protein P3W85_44885, partial [Cupriavidus basilensis]